MNRFETNPAFKFDPDGRTATLYGPLIYRHPLKRLRVPEGFRTDFASIPRGLWNLIPKLDAHLLAAVLHDWLYSTALVPKPEADAIFLDAMAELGVPRWKRYSMYLAVRLFGLSAWRYHRRNDSKEDAC